MSVKSIPTICASVAANPSPLGVKLHDAGYAALNLDFKYVAFGSDQIEPVLTGVRRLGIRGLGVSMPHKTTVIRHLDSVHEDVKAIGACNTVVNEGGTLTGFNTDWQGVDRALVEGGLADCGAALIVGGGGVARAIAYALRLRGVEVTVATRRPDQSAKLVQELGLHRSMALDSVADIDAELVINATPDSGAVEIERFPAAIGVLDVVFSSRETALTDAAEAAGLVSVAGWRMLLHQATAQLELYTGQQAPITEMSAVLEDALPKRQAA